MGLFLHLCTNFDAVHSIKKLSYIIFLAVLAAAFMQRCANPVSPGGGPKDEQPPVVIKSEPPNFSTRFDKKRIQLTFNEFVKLKQANQQILISPPIKTMPTYRLKGKSLYIEFDEELLSNTTYSFFFGNAIVDLTEENPLTDFLYVFSTGDYIDSLSIAGEVLNAYTLKPEENIFVMLYLPDNDTVPVDSLPMLVRPLYVAKTNKDGIFRLQYLRNEQMKLFALRDMNNNYLFDTPDEEIAFAETLILPEKPLTIEPDTTDLNGGDSLIVRDLYHDYYPLRLFKQIDSTQRLLASDAFYPPKFRLIFRYPADSLSLEPINPEIEGDWKIEELNNRRDSLMVWLTRMEPDSLELKISVGDSILDTVLIVIPEKKESSTARSRRGNDEAERPERLTVSSNVKARMLDLGNPFLLTFDDPLISYDFSAVTMIYGADTITGAPFLPADSINRRFFLDIKLEEEMFFDFTFPDSSFFNIYGLTNDSVRVSFRTRLLSDYGNLFLNLQLNDESLPYIVQLLDIKDKVISERYVTQSGMVSFELLNPAVYRLKAVRDKWPNRRWDTGFYPEKRQPEEVYFFPGELQVRSNWDLEETWVID